MKLKHQFIILCAVILVTFGFIAKAHAFEGFYLGGSIGGILPPVNNLGNRITDIVVGSNGMITNDHWSTARKPSMNFTLKLGFAKLFDKRYSGIEASVNKSRYRFKTSKSFENYSIKTGEEIRLSLRDVDFALDYKHGYLLNQKTMIFAKTGLARTRARMILTSNSVVKFGNGERYNHPSFSKHEKIIHPVRIGFGVEHKIFENIAITADYTYSRYLKHFRLRGQSKSSSTVGNVTEHHDHKMTIQDTSIMAGLNVYF